MDRGMTFFIAGKLLKTIKFDNWLKYPSISSHLPLEEVTYSLYFGTRSKMEEMW